eukprot:1150862-Pelagomonas_calceolata.AAC.1
MGPSITRPHSASSKELPMALLASWRETKPGAKSLPIGTGQLLRQLNGNVQQRRPANNIFPGLPRR